MRISTFIESSHLESRVMSEFFSRDGNAYSSMSLAEFSQNAKSFKDDLKAWANSPRGPYGSDRLALYSEVKALIEALRRQHPSAGTYSMDHSFLSNDEIFVAFLKEIHEGVTKEELAEALHMSTQAVYDRANALKSGVRIAGASVQTDVQAGSRLESTVHPVVLPLNLSRVYLLLDLLVRESGGNRHSMNPREALSYELAEMVYSQLSDYAKEVLAPRLDELGVRLYDKRDVCYWDDRASCDLYLAFEKSGGCVRVEHAKGVFEGRILMPDGNDIASRKFMRLLQNDGEVMALNYDDVLDVHSMDEGRPS